ncbi:MAG TPA: hypothetical protein VJA21_18915 [Verrucomicrobiae bacterium]
MKSVVLTSLLAVAFLVSACNQETSKSATSTNATASGTSPLDAPGGYLNALVKGQQSAVKTVDTTSINKAIELFNVDQGRYPKDLNELVQKKFLPQLPAAPNGMKLVYDANAGTVKVEKQ